MLYLNQWVKLGSYYLVAHKKFVGNDLVKFPIENADIIQKRNILVVVPKKGINVFLHIPYRPSKLVKIFTPYEKLFLFDKDGVDCFLLSTKERKIRFVTNQFGLKVWEDSLHQNVWHPSL